MTIGKKQLNWGRTKELKSRIKVNRILAMPEYIYFETHIEVEEEEGKKTYKNRSKKKRRVKKPSKKDLGDNNRVSINI